MRIIFQPTYSSSESQMARAFPRGKNPHWTPQPSMAVHITHTHAHSDWDNVDVLIELLCTPGIWEETGVPGETHADMGRTVNSIQTVAPARNCVFFFSS